MNWADFKIAIAKGLVASAESVANIINGTTAVPKASNADTVDGSHATDFIIRKYNIMRDMDLIAIAEDAAICPAMCATRFRAFNPTNAPVENSDFFVEVQKIDDSWIKIIATTVRSHYEYSNVKSSGTWQGWKCGAYLDEVLRLTGGTVSGNICTDKGTSHTRYEVRRKQSDGSIISSRFFSGSNKDLNIAVFASTDDSDERHCLRMSDDKGLHYRQNAGAWNTVLHTGNSSPVIVSATEPTDKTAVWIVP